MQMKVGDFVIEKVEDCFWVTLIDYVDYMHVGSGRIIYWTEPETFDLHGRNRISVNMLKRLCTPEEIVLIKLGLGDQCKFE